MSVDVGSAEHENDVCEEDKIYHVVQENVEAILKHLHVRKG